MIYEYNSATKNHLFEVFNFIGRLLQCLNEKKSDTKWNIIGAQLVKMQYSYIFI